MYRNGNKNRISLLNDYERNIFTSNDLGLIWEIKDDNLLWTTLKRYTKAGVLYRLKKGIYSKKPISKLHPYEIGCALSGTLSYISTETVLSVEGFMMQAVNKITLVGRKNLEFSINQTDYVCRYVNSVFLINRIGIRDETHYSVASPERALADMYHLSPRYYIDNTLSVKEEVINQINKEVYNR